MAYLPVNLFMIALFMLGIIWGWEGEEMRRLFAVFSAIFMLPLWTAPLFLIVENGGIVSFASKPGWLPTGILEPALFWTVVLMYFTAAHVMEELGREDPVGKMLKRARKQR